MRLRATHIPQAGTQTRSPVVPFPTHRRAIATCLDGIRRQDGAVSIDPRFLAPWICVLLLLAGLVYAAGRSPEDVTAPHHRSVWLDAASPAAAAEPTVADSDPAAYFPAQFPPIKGDVLPHIEAF